MKILVVGGGLSGVCVSAALRRKGIEHTVAEPGFPFTGTRASSGILNPIMGRKRNLVPDYDLLFSKCAELYSYIEELLGKQFFRPVHILEYLESEEAQDLFKAKAVDYPTYLHAQTEGYKEVLTSFIKPPLAQWGITQKAFVLDNIFLQKSYLGLLREEGRLVKKAFSSTSFPVFPFEWEGQTYTHLIYCNGKSLLDVPEIALLPLSVNKGQALLLRLETELPRNLIFKFGKKFTLCPHGEKYWWAGASFEWNYDSEEPTEVFLQILEKKLRETLKISFQVVQPLAGFRVSSSHRKAVAGWLPQNPTVGVVTATGTKGVLQVPTAATEVVESLFCPMQKNLFSLDRLLIEKK